MKKNLTVSPSRSESFWGIGYVFFNYTLLARLVPLLCRAVFPQMGESAINLIYFCVNCLAMFWILRRFLLRELCRFSESLPSVFRIAPLGLLIYFAGNILINAFILVYEPDFLNINDSNISQLLKKDNGLLILGTVLLAPVSEELMFRGALFGTIQRKTTSGAIAISTLLFGAIHVLNYISLYPVKAIVLSFVQYIPAGIALAWAHRKADSIFAPILMHITINTIGVLLMR